jgi:putative ABC transport system ATP-binding protein
VSVLELERVAKRYRRGHRELVVLRSVSLAIGTGEVVCVTGGRRSGRTTLLRIAAGVETPDEGRVQFAGAELHTASRDLRRQLVFGSSRFISPLGSDVIEQVRAPLYPVGVSRDQASLQAHRALERVGVADLALLPPQALVPSEMLRVVLARAIVREPRMVILDEPTNGIDQLERDPLLRLIQTLAHDSGIAVLLTAGETASVTGADRVLRLTEGELLGRSAPASAEVVELRRPAEPPA